MSGSKIKRLSRSDAWLKVLNGRIRDDAGSWIGYGIPVHKGNEHCMDDFGSYGSGRRVWIMDMKLNSLLDQNY